MEQLDLLRSGQYVGYKRLKLSCNLTEFPSEILKLADSLEILDLSNNHLSALPATFGKLKKLKVAFFTNNEFEEFPAVLAACPILSMVSFKGNRLRAIHEQVLSPAIRWLILTDNRLQTLPTDIGRLGHLQKLMLAGNQLQDVPKTLGNCQSLELVRLSANQLEAFPEFVLSMPRLSWLAYAGNPFCSPASFGPRSATATALPTIQLDQLQFGDLLGQGASGLIYQGTWTPNVAASDASLPATAVPGHPQSVAIKLFKGDITSDGLPMDEMRACLAAGSHPHLVTVLGRLGDPYEGKAGLVFSFIPADYTKLGGPPDLETCTRDTYSADTVFTLPEILEITRGIASAAAHLHANGILHGDLYAHNILVNPVGKSVLSDFGAASFYDVTNQAIAPALEQLEVRAFGCLLEELLRRCPVPMQGAAAADATTLASLQRLQQACLLPTPAERPRFTLLHETLAHI